MKTLELFKINDRVAIITGGGGLMGKMHAEVVLELGGKVVLVDIDSDKLNKVTSELSSIFTEKIESYVCDITNEKDVLNFSNYINDKYGNFDILIYNAAINPKVESVDGKNIYPNFEEYSIKLWDADVNVGLKGAFLCSKVLGPYLIKKRGVIINISSDLGVIAPNQTLYSDLIDSEGKQYIKPVSYSIIKSGLIGFTKYLSTYLAKDEIRCNALLPGGIYAGQDEKFINKIEKLIPLGRMARVEDYKGAMAFLISDASIYMTGSSLIVDGGRTAW